MTSAVYEIAERLIGYAESREEIDRSTKALIRHVMGLFAGEPGARLWRRTLSEGLGKKHKPSEILRSGLDAVSSTCGPSNTQPSCMDLNSPKLAAHSGASGGWRRCGADGGTYSGLAAGP